MIQFNGSDIVIAENHSLTGPQHTMNRAHGPVTAKWRTVVNTDVVAHQI